MDVWLWSARSSEWPRPLVDAFSVRFDRDVEIEANGGDADEQVTMILARETAVSDRVQ